MDRGTGRATVHGVAKSKERLGNSTSTTRKGRKTTSCFAQAAHRQWLQRSVRGPWEVGALWIMVCIFPKQRTAQAWRPLPASSKDGQARCEILLSVVFFQSLSAESAFPDDGSKPARGGDHIGAFSVEQKRNRWNSSRAITVITGKAYRVPFCVPDAVGPVVWAVSMLWKKFFSIFKEA